MKVLLIGANGQLGGEVAAAWPDDEIIPTTRAELDVTDAGAVQRVVTDVRPDLVFNTAAFHRVDVCETEPEQSFAVNAIAARNVAQAAEAAGAAVVYISTDFVFAGDLGRAYVEDDARRPLNVYGVSKAAGEDLVLGACRRAYVIRSSGLYGVRGASGKGGNFVETILRRAQETGHLQVVGDQTVSPTYTPDLARGIRAVVQDCPPGVYHVTNSGALTWHAFATRIVALAGLADRTRIDEVTSDSYDQRVRRPAYSVLENAAMRRQGIAPLRPIDEALAAYFAARNS